MTWAFDNLRPLSYDFIMIDPPWDFETWSDLGGTKGGKAHYDCMSIDDIGALPVDYLAGPDCCLFMWCTWPMLPKQIPLLERWRFTYKTGGAWHKKTRHGKTAFGPGYRARVACEPWVIGTIGNPINSKSHRNIFEGVTREHSRKPDEAYRWAETYLPHARRADLFSRQQRRGWESWGHETNKFSPEAA